MKKRRNIITSQPIDPAKLERAKELRRQMTPAEQTLWARLRRNQLGYHFRRQQIIDGFIVDFYCNAAGLVIEVDGAVHQQQPVYDQERDRVLTRRDLVILRVTNEDVLHRLEETLARIASVCRARANPIP